MTLSPQEAQSIARMFIGMLERESECTRRVLAAMPENQLDYKLGEKGRTARELMWHTAASEVWFSMGIVKGEFPMEGEPAAPATVAEILAWYDQHVPAAIANLKTLTPEHLAKEIPFFGMPPMPLVMYMEFWKVHSIHHRGQLSTYLRAMNARVPDIYGGSADEPYQAPANA
ncbi:MAG TPA: DinB family protein [Bryobacteraceae bacterium]|nr:DinB family protein [Bryobacteraceae bacterium]